jgi:RNA polymerase sigma factor (sigma-70 family)
MYVDPVDFGPALMQYKQAIGKPTEQHLVESIMQRFIYPMCTRVVEKYHGHLCADVKEDLVQDAAIKVWRNIHVYDPSMGSAFNFVTKIVRNHFIDSLDKEQRHQRRNAMAIEQAVDGTLPRKFIGNRMISINVDSLSEWNGTMTKEETFTYSFPSRTTICHESVGKLPVKGLTACLSVERAMLMKVERIERNTRTFCGLGPERVSVTIFGTITLEPKQMSKALDVFKVGSIGSFTIAYPQWEGMPSGTLTDNRVVISSASLSTYKRRLPKLMFTMLGVIVSPRVNTCVMLQQMLRGIGTYKCETFDQSGSAVSLL